MALSSSTIRGLTNRIANLREEARKLRQPAMGGRKSGEMELRAATFADDAAAAAEAAMAEQITPDEARTAMRVYTDFLDATPSVQRFMGM